MLSPHELRALEIDAELAKLHATHVEAKSKIAQLESQRALLQTQSSIASTARSGLSFVGVLVLVLAAALAGAVLTGPEPTARTVPAPRVGHP
jgi:hypothetical protein